MTLKERFKQEYYTEAEIAEFLALTRSTLQKKRYTEVDHPPYRKLTARLVVYPKKDFHEWERSREIHRKRRGA